ncbi:MAG: PEP-CTERM sorting domain-containing protein [Betaproteobacteria bacterium]|nr:PEP-CTERM sorting domain-containing protein [Betaproteobacteria bacterium]MBL0297794.1 PEP-CTERM sorting domain-containing protein [Betaproteobacteria bacterium]
MKPIRQLIPSRLAIAALSIAAAIPGIAHADALAQSRLDVTSFQFDYNPSDVSITLAPSVGITSAATFANLVGTPSILPGQSITRIGPQSALFNQNSQITGLDITGNYAGGFASQSGSGLVSGGGASALTTATVALDPQGVPFNSSSGSNTVAQQFDITVGGSGYASVGLDFNADLFLRSYLNAEGGVFLNGSSTAFTNWRLEVFRVGGGRIMEWTPSATGTGFTVACDGTFIKNCVQTAAFDLGQSVNSFNDLENNVVDTGSGAFSLDVDLMGGNNYRFAVTHISNANTDITIPEPSSLALIGLALLGTAVASRRRKA